VIRRGSFTSVNDLRDKLSNFIDYFRPGSKRRFFG
jgi:hypothetical protein